jgi:hypothetical protein
MNGHDPPNLSLEPPPGRGARQVTAAARCWLTILVTLQLATLCCLGFLLATRSGRDSAPVGSPPAGAEHLREVAQQLEDRSVDGQAARAWEAYLEAAPAAPDQAEILYRVGKLYMQSEEFDRAAAALVRCEQLASNDSALTAKIGPHMVSCLRRLGLYGEVGRELSRRVEVDAGAVTKGKVLATLQGDPLTEADLDRMIAQRVDQLLSAQGATGDETAREAYLEQFAAPDIRQRLLRDLLMTELYSRRARELHLDQDDEFQQARRAVENDLLASRLQARRLQTIQPTAVDLQAFFAAHAQRYQQPETLAVVPLELAADEDPAAVLAKVASADDFKKLAEQRRSDTEAASQDRPRQVPAQELVRGQRHPVLGDVDTLFALDEGRWTSQPHVHEDRRFLVLVDRKTPARSPPLDEVRDRVRADYVARKRQELTDALFAELMDRYQVKILAADASTDAQTDPQGDANRPASSRGDPRAKSDGSS